MMLPPVALSYTAPFPAATFDEFRNLLASGGTSVEIEERKASGPYAGLEWLIPTAVIVFLGKAYFDGFLKEMGKDHYAVLKQGLKTLYTRLVGPKAPQVTVVGSAGKVRSPQQYSLVFSLLAEAEDGVRFKLLLQAGLSEAEYEATISAFIAFLDAFHRRQLTAVVVDELRKTKAVGKTILLTYKAELGRVVPIDPVGNRGNEA